VKIRKFLVPVMMLGMAALASAQSPAPQKPATINMQKAMLSTKDGEKASGELQTKFAPRNAAIEKKKSDLLAKQDQLKKGGATMSQEAQARMAREIDADQKAIQRDQEDFEADLQAEEGKIYNELGARLYEVLGKYATQNGLSLVMDTSNQQSPVIWADNTIDITADIVKLYDLAHPTAAAAAPATAPSATKPAVLPAAPAPVTKKQ
jgi:outer membrane protein